MASYLGIDLGTTNTVAAVFDGESVTLVRGRDGTLTPSVVRIDAKGRVTVGARARRTLDRDPENTRSEFKRLMGTGKAVRFPAAGVDKRPEELSAEVLRSIREDVREQYGFLPERAVISVPALFELPQCSATSDAARLAGFERVELIQEPVASALAAGWSAEENASGSWLVYDLGGGTFDVSLLETREGLLRVIGHDGDNFLGGRDIEQAMIDWVLARLASDGTPVDRSDLAHAVPLRVLRSALEEAKIELGRAEEVAVSLPALFTVDGAPIDVDLSIDRPTLETLMAPIVDRSIAVCRRLLATYGLRPEQLERVVLVGGPTVVPFLRGRVRDALGAPFVDGVDPMTLVARGAALHAASARLDARPSPPEVRAARRLWLEYPAMSSDPNPFVVGRLLDGPERAPTEVRFVRADGGHATPWVKLRPDGALLTPIELAQRKPNVFSVEGRDAAGAVELRPASITIVHGVTVSDPPLARSVGVALANDLVHTYLERGTPLPAKRTFVHHTVETVSTGAGVLAIPIVQGELPQAHLCRLVGKLELDGADLRGPLPVGSEIEVTIEVDRGGQLSARALIPRLSQVVERVAHLGIPDADPAVLADSLRTMRERLAKARRKADADSTQLDRLFDVDWALQDADAALHAARGGDDDAGQKARRLLIDADGSLVKIEEASAWPEIAADAALELATAARWVSEYGTQEEHDLLRESERAVAQARDAKRPAELHRQLELVRRLRDAAFFRHPDAYRWSFEQAAARASEATDLERAHALVREGRGLARGDREGYRRVANALWGLLPHDPHERAAAFDSGLR
ncbi:MAG: Hsp70 family protein [Myxococcota bacterium]